MVVIESRHKEKFLKILKKIPPFDLLTEEHLELVTDNLREKTYPADTYVFRQGDKSQGILFIVVSGLLEITIVSKHGIEKITGYRKPFEFFGITALLAEEEYSVSVKTLEETKCYLISNDIIEQLVDYNPDVAKFFSKILTNRIKTLYETFVREDPFQGTTPLEPPLKKRIADLMSSPPVICFLEDSVQYIARLMKEKHVSSVVVLDDNKSPVGIITEKDLVTKVLATGGNIEKLRAKDIKSLKLLTVSPKSFFYNALLIMVKNNISHLVVTSETKLAGIVTLRDLVKSRNTGALTIVNSIESKTDIDGLIMTRKEIDKVLEALVAEKASVREICELITEFYDRLTRKIIEISEKDLVREGLAPPVSYSWINMGSSGRKEQFMRTDQDNGIIYEDVPEDMEPETNKYFLLLGKKIVEGLSQFGFEKCKGNVMASNPVWCHSLKNWRKKVADWIAVPNPDHVRMMTIFLDFRHIYGKKVLCDTLKAYVIKKFQTNHVSLQYLAKDDLQHKVPLGFLKKIVTEKSKEHRNMVNLKSSACVHIVDCLRVFSLREGIEETSTFLRVKELTEKNVFSCDDSEMVETAFEALMMFRIRESLKKIKQGQPPDNYITPKNMSKRERAILKEAFLAVDRLQNLTSYAFHIYMNFG